MVYVQIESQPPMALYERPVERFTELNSKATTVQLPRLTSSLEGAIAQKPQALSGGSTRRGPSHVVASLLQEGSGRVIVRILETDLVGHKLVV